jgi:hypothetical protein
MKDITDTMKAYMEMFDIDEVRKFVAMKEERVMETVDSMLKNNKRLVKIAGDVIE